MIPIDQERAGNVTSPGMLAAASVTSALAGVLTFAARAYFINRLTDPHGSVNATDIRIAEYLQLATLCFGCISVCFIVGGYWNRRGDNTTWIAGVLCLFLGIGVILMSFVMF